MDGDLGEYVVDYSLVRAVGSARHQRWWGIRVDLGARGGGSESLDERQHLERLDQF